MTYTDDFQGAVATFLSAVGTERRALEDKLAEAKNELADAKSLAGALGIENAALHNQVANLEAAVADALADITELNELIRQQSAANALLTTQVRQLRATVKTYLAQIATLKARIAELEAQIPAPRCASPVWQTSVPRGTNWVKPGSTTVRVLNEVWNDKEAGPQTIKVCSASSWLVEANHPKVGVPPDRYGAVKSYPCTQVLFAKPTIASLTSLTSRWAHEAPARGEWNACYDIWLGGLGSASTAEVMIWTDHRYPGNLPPGNALKSTTLSVDGATYTAWTRKNSNGGDYIALVRQLKATDGSVNLKNIFSALTQLGWIKSTDTLAAVNYGIELSNTEFTPATFWLNDFKLEHNGTQLV
jgi:hypothetical protein